MVFGAMVLCFPKVTKFHFMFSGRYWDISFGGQSIGREFREPDPSQTETKTSRSVEGYQKTVGGRITWEVRRESPFIWEHVSRPSIENVVRKMLSWRLSPGARQIPLGARRIQH